MNIIIGLQCLYKKIGFNFNFRAFGHLSYNLEFRVQWFYLNFFFWYWMYIQISKFKTFIFYFFKVQVPKKIQGFFFGLFKIPILNKA